MRKKTNTISGKMTKKRNLYYFQPMIKKRGDKTLKILFYSCYRFVNKNILLRYVNATILVNEIKEKGNFGTVRQIVFFLHVIDNFTGCQNY